MSRFFKKFVDLILLILFFSGLASMFLPARIHELLGCAFVIMVIVHNFANRNFYRSIPHGKITRARLLNCICMLIFSLSIGALIFSGVALSNYVFADLKVPEILNWRSVHLASAVVTLFVLFAHLLIYINRYIKNRAFKVVAIMLFVIAALSVFGMPYLDRWYHKVEVDTAQIIQGKQVQNFGKVITIYFSRVGNTDFPAYVDAVSGASLMLDHKDQREPIGNAQMIAMMAQNTVGGDIYEIQTVNKYPAEYSETVKIAKEPVEVKEYINLDPYDKIILVYPLWWYTLPVPVETFIKHYDLSGKIIIPIVTHGGSGVSDSTQVLQQSTNAKVFTDCLDIYSSDIPSSRSKIYNYLSSVRFK